MAVTNKILAGWIRKGLNTPNVKEAKSVFFQTSRGGDEPHLACALGLAVIGKIGLKKTIALDQKVSFWRDQFSSVLKINPQKASSIIYAHCTERKASATEIARRLEAKEPPLTW